MASVYYGGMFDTASIHLPDKVTRKEDLSSGTEFNNKLIEFMTSADLVCGELILNSQQYKNGDVVVTNVKDRDVITVGVIQTILVRGNKVYFVTRKYEAVRNQLNFFVTDSVEPYSSFVNSIDLVDYKPLIRYGTDQKFKFYLHHYVSVFHD